MTSSRVRIRAVPGSRRAEIVGPHATPQGYPAWKVRVVAAPEKGKANSELIELLAEVLEIARNAVAVVAGASSRDKVVKIDGLTSDQIEERLGTYLSKQG